MEIRQNLTTILYIHFVFHLQIIPHASMYHPNISLWSYIPPTPLLISTTTSHRLMPQHLRPLPYYNKLYCHHLTTSPHHSHIYQHLRFSITPIPSLYPIPFWSTLQSISRDLSRVTYPKTTPFGILTMNKVIHVIVRKPFSILTKIQEFFGWALPHLDILDDFILKSFQPHRLEDLDYVISSVRLFPMKIYLSNNVNHMVEYCIWYCLSEIRHRGMWKLTGAVWFSWRGL